MFFNFNATNIPAYWCQSKTVAAKRFTDIYGEVFIVEKIIKGQDSIGVIYKTGTEELVRVERKSDGIYVNEEFFAKNWDDENEYA